MEGEPDRLEHVVGALPRLRPQRSLLSSEGRTAAPAAGQ